MSLTTDQRWLLFGVGGWNMVGCLARPEYGIPQLFQSMLGSSHLGDEVYEARPAWKGHGFTTTGKYIQLGWGRGDDDAPNVRVSRQQLATYAKHLPQRTVDLLREHREATTLQSRIESAHAPLESRRPAHSIAKQKRGFHAIHARHLLDEKRLLRLALDLDDGEPADLLELLAMDR